jgi:hypothetical protein
LLKLGHVHSRIGEDPSQCALGDVAAFMHRHRGPSTVWMSQHMMTARDSDHLESGSL